MRTGAGRSMLTSVGRSERDSSQMSPGVTLPEHGQPLAPATGRSSVHVSACRPPAQQRLVGGGDRFETRREHLTERQENTYRGSPVPVTGTDGALQLIGLHGLGVVTRKGEPL